MNQPETLFSLALVERPSFRLIGTHDAGAEGVIRLYRFGMEIFMPANDVRRAFGLRIIKFLSALGLKVLLAFDEAAFRKWQKDEEI